MYRNRISKRLFTMAVMVSLTLLAACAGQREALNSPTSASPIPISEPRNPPQETAEEVAPEPKNVPFEGELELPVTGATGYAPVRLELKASADPNSKTLGTLDPGTAFEIIAEDGEWWLVKLEGLTGWLPHQYCMINLPDVIPSIVYDNTNTYASMFTSSGKSLPDISGRALYASKAYNERLGKEAYITPVLYTMSKKIHKAQQNALAEGNALKIHEGFRPYAVQKAVVKSLKTLAQQDAEVMAGINTPPWGITWFIVDGVSNHQVGYAIDVSLVKVNAKEEIAIGRYSCISITDYTEYKMPTPIHELSGKSAIFTTAVTSKSPIAWKSAIYRDSMTEAAINLQRYCTDAGLTPLASEWWHFNDLEARDQTANHSSDGKYEMNGSLNSVPM